MRNLEAIRRVINRIMMLVGGVAALGLMVLATTNVAFRILKIPFRGTYELVGYLGAIAVAFALGESERRKNHLEVDVITRRYPPRIRNFVDGMRHIVLIVFFSLVAWQSFSRGMRIQSSGEVSETLKVIYYPFIYIVSIGFAALVLNLFVDLLALLANKDKGQV